jgi:WD40 repeat protein
LGELSALALAPRGAMLAAADGRGQVWLARGAEAPRRLPLALPPGERIVALALDERGERLAVAASHGEVWVLDAAGRLLATLPGFGAGARRLAWAADGERLATDCEAASLCLWRRERRPGADADGDGGGGSGGGGDGGGDGDGDGDGMVLDSVLALQGAAAGALAWSPDSRRLAGGDLDGRVHVWDVAAPAGGAALLRAAAAPPLADIDVDPSGQRIASAGGGGRTPLWDLPPRRVLRRFEHRVGTEARALRFHPRRALLALATLGGGVELFALDRASAAARIEGTFESLAWDGAHDLLISGGQDGVVRSHPPDGTAGQVLAEPHGDAVVALAVAPATPDTVGQPAVIYSADTRGVIKARGGAPGAQGGADSGTVASVTDASGKPFSVGTLAFAPHGRQWLAAGAAGDVLVFDRATRRLLQRLQTGADQVHASAFSPDARFIAAIDNAGRLQLWSAPQWQAHATLWLRREPGRSAGDALGALGALRRLAWLPDSQRIAVATQSGAVVLVTLPALPAPLARQ